MRWFLSLLSAAGLLSACTQSHLHEGDAGRVPLFPTTREAPDPTIVLPANFRLQELTGIDSRPARINGPGLVVNVDMGRTGGVQRCDSLSECEAGNLTVDGRPASWVLFRMTDPAMVQGWPYRMHFWIKLFPAQDPNQGPVSGLLYSAGCTSRDICRAFTGVAATTRFHRP